MPNDATRDAAIREIARRELLIETLERVHGGGDFHEVAVWMVEAALKAAYEAGRNAGIEEIRRRRTPARLTCPACKRQIDIVPLT